MTTFYEKHILMRTNVAIETIVVCGGERCVTDDVDFDGCECFCECLLEHDGYDIMELINEELHPIKCVSHSDSDLVSDVDTNHPLDDVAHIVEFEHENKGNVEIHKMTTDDPWLNKLVEDPDDEQVQGKERKELTCPQDVSQGKCVGKKGKKPKPIDNEECESSKRGSKKGACSKQVNEKISKATKERWEKKK
ncbi:hypothetical protein Tco_0849681 [Tanacetum coccineum]